MLTKLAVAVLLTTQAAAFVPAPSHVARSPTPISLNEKRDVSVDDAITRRSWLANTAAVVSAAAFLPANAVLAADDLTAYQNQVLNFQISYPSSWEKSVQQLPDRRSITLFIDPTSGEDKTLMFYASTPIRDDFTSLGSFGSVDEVAQSTILPKGQLQGDATPSVMLNTASKKNAYFFDYKATPPNLPETHYRVIFALVQGGTGGAGAVLMTLTIQTPESRYAEMKPLFDKMVDSYGKAQA